MPTAFGIGLGLILGSFLSVLLERLPASAGNGPAKGIVAGRSECPHCHHMLAWHDLVPLVSYVVLRGRCRYCKASISPLYPILEGTMAIVLASYVFRFGIPTVWYAVDLLVLFGLVALFFFDLKYQILPDVIMFPLIGVVMIRMITQRPDLLLNAGATGIFLAAVFGFLYLISKGRWLGLGDVKMALLIGVLFGYPIAVGVTLVAIWLGALLGVGLMLRKRATMQTALPFGAFWAFIAVVAIVWYEPIAFVSGLFTPAFLP